VRLNCALAQMPLYLPDPRQWDGFLFELASLVVCAYFVCRLISTICRLSYTFNLDPLIKA